MFTESINSISLRNLITQAGNKLNTSNNFSSAKSITFEITIIANEIKAKNIPIQKKFFICASIENLIFTTPLFYVGILADGVGYSETVG